MGETKPRIQRWMELLSAYNFRLSYRRGQENANADFLSRLPLPPIADNVSGASALSDPDDLGVYLIRACTAFPQAPCTIYAINARDDAPRPTRRTRCQTANLDGNTPSRPDYRTAAHSGFAASATAASLRTSPPPRSARLGSTTSPGRRAPISSTPRPADLQSVPPPFSAPLHPTAPDPDIQAAAAQLSNILLNYSHSDWEQAQRDDPLCDATRRYIQLGCPQYRLTSLCDHIPSHRRPASTDILDLAAEGRLIQGDYGTTLFVRNHSSFQSS